MMRENVKRQREVHASRITHHGPYGESCHEQGPNRARPTIDRQAPEAADRRLCPRVRARGQSSGRASGGAAEEAAGATGRPFSSPVCSPTRARKARRDASVTGSGANTGRVIAGFYRIGSVPSMSPWLFRRNRQETAA